MRTFEDMLASGSDEEECTDEIEQEQEQEDQEEKEEELESSTELAQAVWERPGISAAPLAATGSGPPPRDSG